jgi:hypothetical protein
MNSNQPAFDDLTKRFLDFAQRDYEMKVTYLANQFQRMWTRFNYFVVIESALIGGKTIFGDHVIGKAGLVFGLGLSLVWYVMGAEDRFLVQLYREQLKDAAKVMSDALCRDMVPPYTFVGDVSDANERVKPSLSGWRVENFSTTRLAALIPLAVSLIWLGLLVRAFLK